MKLIILAALVFHGGAVCAEVNLQAALNLKLQDELRQWLVNLESEKCGLTELKTLAVRDTKIAEMHGPLRGTGVISETAYESKIHDREISAARVHVAEEKIKYYQAQYNAVAKQLESLKPNSPVQEGEVAGLYKTAWAQRCNILRANVVVEKAELAHAKDKMDRVKNLYQADAESLEVEIRAEADYQIALDHLRTSEGEIGLCYDSAAIGVNSR